MQTRGWALPLTLLLSLVIPTMGAADEDNSKKHSRTKANLVKTLRESFDGYKHMAPPGYVPDPYCASGVDGGAVGIHFVNFGLVDDGVLNVAEPEVLYYEPLPGGRIRLVGAEYVYAEVPFGTPPVTPQHLEGHLLQYIVDLREFTTGTIR